MRVAVTGASGLVGTALVPALSAEGHEVLRLVRRQPREPGEIYWDPDRSLIDAEVLEGVEGVVHLSGANIAGGRFTENRKTLLRASRVGPTRLLCETLARLSDADLGERIAIRGESLAVHEAFHRSLAHTASHVGQIVLLGKNLRGTEWRTLTIPRAPRTAPGRPEKG